MKPKSDHEFESIYGEFPGPRRPRFWPLRSIRHLMMLAALSGLAMATLSMRPLPRPINPPRRNLVYQLPAVPHVPPRASDNPMIKAAPQGIDDAMIRTAQWDIDEGMIHNPYEPNRQPAILRLPPRSHLPWGPEPDSSSPRFSPPLLPEIPPQPRPR